MALDIYVPGTGHVAEGGGAGGFDQVGDEEGAAGGEVVVQIGEEVALGCSFQMVDGEGGNDGAESGGELGAPIAVEELDGASFPAVGKGFEGAGGFGEHFLGAVEGEDGGVWKAAEDGGGEPAGAGGELDDLELIVGLGGDEIEESLSELVTAGSVDLALVDEDLRVGFVPGSFGHRFSPSARGWFLLACAGVALGA